MPTIEEREKAYHESAKEKIKAKRDFDLTAQLSLEGVQEGLLISIVIAIETIIGLLFVPELISKVVALIASIVTGLITAGVVVYILISSKTEVKDIWDAYQVSEKREDDRHQRALETGEPPPSPPPPPPPPPPPSHSDAPPWWREFYLPWQRRG